MAIYYCKTNHVQRSTGRSAVAAAAYRSADKLTDVNGKKHDYTRKNGVLHNAIITPKILILSATSYGDLQSYQKQEVMHAQREKLLSHYPTN